MYLKNYKYTMANNMNINNIPVNPNNIIINNNIPINNQLVHIQGQLNDVCNLLDYCN